MQTKMFNLGLLGALVLSSVSAFASDATSASATLDLVKAHKVSFACVAAFGAGALFAGQQAWDRHTAPARNAAAKKASDEARAKIEAEVRASLENTKKDAPSAPGQAPAAAPAAVAAAPADVKAAQEALSLDDVLTRRTHAQVHAALASENFGAAVVGAVMSSKQLKELLEAHQVSTLAKLKAELAASKKPQVASEDGDESEDVEAPEASVTAGAAASPSSSAVAAASAHAPVKAKKAKKARSVPSDAKEISEKKDLKDKSKASDHSSKKD